MQVRSISDVIVYHGLVVLSYYLVKSIIDGYRFSLVYFYLFTLFEFEYFGLMFNFFQVVDVCGKLIELRMLRKFDEGN